MSNQAGDPNSAVPLRHTPLYALHEAKGAKFMPFAGYAMPVEYGKGIKYEHLHTRTAAGLFDVSHMGQIALRGKTIADDFETLVPSDIRSLAPFGQRYSVLTNDRGGIVDDLMITRLPEYLLVVANAAFKAGDITHIEERLRPGCTAELLEGRALIALQGPAAAACLGQWDDTVNRLGFMQAGRFQLAGIDCLVHRCGYTGGDGFELSSAAADAESLAAGLLELDAVEPIGLGARDTLRLEAGLCLAGVDFDPATTPVEAALEWVIARKYRRDPQSTPRFPGAAVILEQLKDGVTRRRVGFAPCGKIPVRSDTQVFHGDSAVGRVTSGSYGPSLGAPVAMGYVNSEFSTTGTELRVVVRGRSHAIRVADLPFVPHAYYQS